MSEKRLTRRGFVKCLAVATGASVLAACTPPAEPSKPTDAPGQTAATKPASPGKVTLRIGTWWDIWQPMIDMFTKRNPDIGISYEVTPGDGYSERMLTQIAGGDYPDSFMVRAEYFPQLALKNLFLPIDDMVAADGIDMSLWMMDQKEWCGANDKLYGFVRGAAIPDGLYYNKKLFDEAGIKYPENDWTWEDLMQAAKALTKGEEQWGVKAIGRKQALWLQNVLSNGGQLYNEDETKCLLNEPPAVEAFQWMVDQVLVEKVAPSPAQVPHDDTAAFTAGKLGMCHHFAQWWAYKQVSNDFQVDCWPILYPNTTKVKVHTAQAHPWCMGKDTKVKEQAWNWVKFITMDKEPLTYLTQTQVPGAYDFPALIATLEPKQQEFYKVLQDRAQYIKPERYGVKAGTEVVTIVNTEVDLMFLGQKTVKQALDDAVAQINALLV